MPKRLQTSDPGFEQAFAAFLGEKREVSADVDAAVAAIVADVKARGDAALVDLSRKFDHVDLDKVGMRVTPHEIRAAYDACEKETIAALELARERIEEHHRRQLPVNERYTDEIGVELGWRWTAVEFRRALRPGRARVLSELGPDECRSSQGRGRPTPRHGRADAQGRAQPLVLAAARLAGVEEIYRVGGAQAVAALAHGTRTIAPVAKIVGPGNAYVAAAKRQVFGIVGIDSIAGPSEVLIIADKHNDPEWIAADLLAQAEHDTAAQSILMTDDAAFARTVEAAVMRQLGTLPRGNIAGESWNVFGAVIELRSLDEAPALADRIAAEHLEIATREPEQLTDLIRNAGAIFIGKQTPEMIGDYIAGSNHVLPTARSARFSSGLGVLDFMKRTSLLKLDGGALAALAPAAMRLARAEGLEAHRRSAEVRLGKAGPGAS